MSKWMFTNVSKWLKNHTHHVTIYRFYEDDWGYMGMRDYRTEEPTNRFFLHIRKSYVDYKGNIRVDSTSKEIRTGEFGKDEANIIAYNLNHKEFDYETFVNALKTLGVEV